VSKTRRMKGGENAVIVLGFSRSPAERKGSFPYFKPRVLKR